MIPEAALHSCFSLRCAPNITNCISRSDILDVIRAEPWSLITRDTVTHMLPFMLLASRMGHNNPDKKMERIDGGYYAASDKSVKF
mmetsp:Transcript_3668/g.8303  ORF Transcript_3668/g.8303 Transcript_3668/m.8303 type:complete len:85 (-) Transcript_3668:241-495(-)